jgi:hypothetical protein
VSPIWRKHTGNPQCSPRAIVHARSLEDLTELVKRPATFVVCLFKSIRRA